MSTKLTIVTCISVQVLTYNFENQTKTHDLCTVFVTFLMNFGFQKN